MLDFERAEKILEYYKIQPRYMEQHGKVIKIFTPYGNYALKEYSVDKRSPVEMIQTVANLYQKGFQNVAPIFRGQRGEYLVEDESEYFYLMPWYEEQHDTDKTHRYEQMFKQLAVLHNKTSDVREIKEEEIDGYVEQFRSQLEMVQERMDYYLEECEAKTYMSPSELQYCSIYFKGKQSIDFALERLEKWEGWTKELKETRSVLNHGDVSLQHYVVDRTGNGYFINFEKSQEASPINDLLPITNELLEDLPIYNDTKWNWMSNYFQNFSLSKGERTLYMVHLSNPLDLFRFVNNANSRDVDERQKVVNLLNIYWKMVNSEYIVSRLLEIEAAEDASESES